LVVKAVRSDITLCPMVRSIRYITVFGPDGHPQGVT